MKNLRRNDYNDLFDYFVPGFRPVAHERFMKTDVKETDTNYVIETELPGFSKENVKVALENGYITISGYVEEKNDEENKHKFIRRERHHRSISRSFYVGEDYEQNDINAKFSNGLLTVVLPKEPTKKVKEKTYIAIE